MGSCVYNMEGACPAGLQWAADGGVAQPGAVHSTLPPTPLTATPAPLQGPYPAGPLARRDGYVPSRGSTFAWSGLALTVTLAPEQLRWR